MAVVQMFVANPTGADITVNTKTAVRNRITQLAFDDAALVNGWNDAVSFLNQGCAIVHSTGTMQQREQEGFLIAREERDVIGAGGLA